MKDPIGTLSINNENVISWTLEMFDIGSERWSPEFLYKDKVWQLYVKFTFNQAELHLCNYCDRDGSFSVEISFQNGSFTSVQNTAEWDGTARYKLHQKYSSSTSILLYQRTFCKVFCKIEKKKRKPAAEKDIAPDENDDGKESCSHQIGNVNPSVTKTPDETDDAKENSSVRIGNVNLSVTKTPDESGDAKKSSSVQIENVTKNALLSCSQYKSMILGGQACDITIKIIGKKFQVHRAVLRDNSSFFSKVFDENENNIVSIDEFDVEIFQDLLLFMYSGKIEDMSCKNFQCLYSASHKYGLTRLKKLCVDSMKSSLTDGTVFEIMHLAKVHGETSLLEHSTNFFATNAERVLATAEWKNFLKENLTQANEMLIDVLRQRQRNAAISNTNNFRESVYKRFVAMTLDPKNQRIRFK